MTFLINNWKALKITPLQLSVGLVVSWLVVTLIAIVLGFSGNLYPVWAGLLFLPWGLLGASIFLGFTRLVLSWSSEQKMLGGILGGVWLLHFTNVLVPETGFDALWYHLPIIAQFAYHHQIFYWPEFYQSLNPLASDLVFLLGWQLAGDIGAKLVAYSLAVSLIIVSYQVARRFLSRSWSLLTVLLISLFQVITWQSGSVYVDIAKAFWEVSAVWFLLQVGDVRTEQRSQVSWLVVSSVSFGASLASKLFSLVLWPVFTIMTVGLHGWGKAVVFALVSILIGLPFYLFTWQHVGTPFYSLGVHTAKLGEIGGQPSVLWYVTERTLQLPLAIKELLFTRDYTTPLLVPLMGLLAYLGVKRKLKITKELGVLLFFSLCQLGVWWYLPPLSSRYALSGFITLLIVGMSVLELWLKGKPQLKRAVLIIIAVTMVVMLLPRIYVLARNLPFITGRQTKREYLERFLDGNIDEKLKAWYPNESS